VKGREFSVIICTFNGASRIEQVLTALAELNPGTVHEIILVDNCSTDGVATVASTVWNRIARQPVDFRIIFEPTLGLSAARRAGVRAATRDLVVFCDDDNLLAPNYLEVAASIMADETIGAAGGVAMPIMGGEATPIFLSYAGWYAVGVQALDGGEIELLWGAGIVVRRKLLVQLYDTPGFPVLVGRRGSALTTGEDHEICYGVSFLGHRLWYDERLTFRHIIPSERISEIYIRRMLEGVRLARPIVNLYAELHKTTNETFQQRLRSILSATARLPMFVQRRDARFFGLIARFRMTLLMTFEERAIFEIFCSLRKSRRREGVRTKSHAAAAFRRRLNFLNPTVE
jgi:glycosyltransferase involved in cell wall biosynthesis